MACIAVNMDPARGSFPIQWLFTDLHVVGLIGQLCTLILSTRITYYNSRILGKVKKCIRLQKLCYLRLFNPFSCNTLSFLY